MMVVTSKRLFETPSFVGDFVKIVYKGQEPIFVKRCKYIDCTNDYVYIFDADSRTCVPTYSTIRKSRALDESSVDLGNQRSSNGTW